MKTSTKYSLKNQQKMHNIRQSGAVFIARNGLSYYYNEMKNIGETIKWKTLNGYSEGKIIDIELSYTVKTKEGKVVIVSDKDAEGGKR